MTMRDLHNNITHVTAVAPQTIAGVNLQSGNIDLSGFNAAEVVTFLGGIDELGASPVGAAKLEVKLEHADDDGTGSPVFFSIHGTGQEEAVELLRARLRLEPFDLMDDAIKAAIEAAR